MALPFSLGVLVALTSCGRGSFTPVVDSNGVTDAAADAGVSVYFADDFEDGDHATAPASTTMMSCNAGNCGTMTTTTVTDGDGAWLQVMRSGAPPDGGALRVMYSQLAIPTGPTLRLRYRIRLAYDQFNAGGSFCREFGGAVHVHLTLTDSTQVTLNYVHNYGTMQCLPDATWRYSLLPMGTWTNLEHDLVEHLTAAGLAAPMQLDEVRVGGSGWNFESHFDDVAIVP